MLRDVYMQVGLGWTVLIGGLVMFTVLTWFIAVAGAVTRPMTRRRRAFLLALLTVMPPSAIVVLARFVQRALADYRVDGSPDESSASDLASRITLHRSRLSAAA